ncbi:ATP-binding cassette domain-containing protein [Paeniglutamicibacter sp. ZC-3]|nr:ATP-binding cassette domain-containing protein [Paeniglutamicibacter sp. ZC-3]MCV9993335.1 ATP-binding cassette domain-containing protein [Paeniglutamicibacter sp. ZC-3]
MHDQPVQPILAVDNLCVDYRTKRRRGMVRIVHDVSFTIAPGETLALVGESGSGKSTIGKAILGLEPVAAGSVHLEGLPIHNLPPKGRRALATKLQVIFQNPYGSLNPALTIGQILAEPLLASGAFSAHEAQSRISTLLERVNLPGDASERYPAQFSGGQRQRVAIARALALEPAVIICDEPTSALDVTTQSRILELMTELRESIGVAYLFISHDLAVVRDFADRTAVLQQGRIVETGESRSLCDSPTHPYTRNLVASAPVPDPRLQRQRRLERMSATG